MEMLLRDINAYNPIAILLQGKRKQKYSNVQSYSGKSWPST